MPSPSRQSASLFGPRLAGDLKRDTVRGGAVTLVSQGSRFVLQLGSTAVLARMLNPEHFGWVGMVTALTGALVILRDAGLSMATVQRETVTEEQVSALFWINAALGLVLAGITVALAPAIAWFYTEPRLQAVTAALALTSVFSGLAAQHQALLRRQMRLPAIAAIEIVSVVASVALGIGLAWRGWDYWALVWMPVAQAAVMLAGSWLAIPWLPGRPRLGVGIQSMLRFGGYFTGSNLMNYLFRNADNVLIGRVWGAGPLGLYAKAYGLLMLPISQINSPLSGVAVPALSRLQRQPERFRRYFLGGYTVAATVIVPLVVILAIFAPEVVAVMLGPKWSEAVPIFRLLAPAALIGALLNPFGWIFVSLGRPDRQFWLGIVWSTLIVASFVAGLRYGPAGVAAGYSIMSLLLAWPLCVYSLQGTVIRLGDLWAAVRAPALATLVAAAVGLLLQSACGGWPAWLAMMCGTAGAGLTYLLILLVVLRKWPFYRDLLSEMFPAKWGKGLAAAS